MPDELLEIAERPGRLDVFLADCTDLSRNRLQTLIRGGIALVNGAAVTKAGTMLRAGDAVRLTVPDAEPLDAKPEDIPLSIVYEDDALCVVDKPQGMVVHPAPGHASGTLVNALLYRLGDLSGVGGALRPGIVHRIDRMTSGLLVVAKTDAAHQSLSAQFASHEANRSYYAIVDGNLREDTGTVDAAVGRHATDRKRMAVRADGRRAVTRWEVVERFGTHTLLRLRLETGRTHQIRVHMAFIKHPVTGDEVYGLKKPQLGLIGQALHGYLLQFTHPATKERLRFFSPLPPYFAEALKKLGFAGDISALTAAEADQERTE